MIGRLIFAMCGWLACHGALALTIEDGDAGFSYQFRTLRGSFTVINDSDKEIGPLSIKPANAQDRLAAAMPERLAPGQRAVIDVELRSEDDFGARWHGFFVSSPASEKPLVARVRVFGLSVLEDPQQTFDFGVVEAGATPQLEYEIRSDDPRVRIKAVKETPAFLSARVADDGRKLIFKHAPVSAWGRLDGLVKVTLDSPDQPEAWLRVISEVQGVVKPSTTIFSLGLARVGSDNEFILQYRRDDDKPFRIDSAVVDGIATKKVTIEECANGEKGCRQVRFLLDEEKQPKGQLRGTLKAHVADLDREIFVVVGGLLVGKDTKIESLDSAMMAKNAPASADKDLGLALKKLKSTDMDRPVEPATPPGEGPLLRWSVDNDGRVYAYGIYRADRADGPFALQSNFVRRSSVAREGVPSLYALRDTTAVAGKDYWYRIAMFYPDGKHEFLTGPQHVKATAGAAKETTKPAQ